MLTIIIISYNTAKLTKQAILSVIKDAETSQLEHEVIVVDNASRDNSPDVIRALQKKYPQIKLVANKKNLGFAKANNQAIKHVQGEFIFLLNSDTIVKPNTLKALTTDLKTDSKLGAVGALLIRPDGSLQNQGGDIPGFFNVLIQMLFLDDLPLIGKHLPSPQKNFYPQKSPTEIGWAPATALMLKRKVVKKVGPLDEAIFMYAEDVDYSIRIRQVGYTIAIEPQAKVIHLGSASSSSEQAVIGEFLGILYLAKKYKHPGFVSLFKFILMLGASLRIMLFYLLGQRERSRVYKHALDKITATSYF